MLYVLGQFGVEKWFISIDFPHFYKVRRAATFVTSCIKLFLKRGLHKQKKKRGGGNEEKMLSFKSRPLFRMEAKTILTVAFSHPSPTRTYAFQYFFFSLLRSRTTFMVTVLMCRLRNISALAVIFFFSNKYDVTVWRSVVKQIKREWFIYLQLTDKLSFTV